MEQDPSLKRTPLSRKLCELFDWIKPEAELKDMTCRVALLRMQPDGLITLPPPRPPCGAADLTLRPPRPPTRKPRCCSPCTSLAP